MNESINEKKVLRNYLNDKRVIAFLLVILVLITGVSYALWQLTLRQTDENRIVTGCLKLNFTEETDAITLNEAVPMLDEEGKKLTPYTFTIENTCKTKTKYVVNLETVSDGEKVLADNFIKAQLLKDNNEVFLSKLTTEHENQEKVIETARAAYMLDQGDIDSNQTVSYSLRLWIDSESSNLEEMMNAVFAGKITITASYIPKRDTNEKLLYNIVEKQASLDNIASEFVTSETGIDFKVAPSDTNGKGVYTIASTKDYYYPVHYFRGEVTNNNVKFANFCWKIVRTTETGGVKLIYNGTPNDGGGCTNTGEASQIGTSVFNSNYTSSADVGYMYGTRYTYNSKTIPETKETWIYGNDVDYIDGKYVLKNTTEYSTTNFETDKTTGFNAHRYTCFSSTNTCENVNYLYYNEYYIVLTSGKKIDDALKELTTESGNTTASTIKMKIDNWYSSNMLDYTEKLEDTIWCNDRSISRKNGWDKDSTTSDYLYFEGRERNSVPPYNPSIECSNANDKFTVSSEKGNGKLTYPVALLTADEVTLAGLGKSGSSKSYLYTGQWWWTFSPSAFSNSTSNAFSINTYLDNYGVDRTYGVRPSVSLAPGVMITGTGNGSQNNPYEIA